MVSSKIIYKQQFDAAVQKKNILQTARVREIVIATVNGKKYKNRCVSDTTAVVVHMAKFIYPPGASIQ